MEATVVNNLDEDFYKLSPYVDTVLMSFSSYFFPVLFDELSHRGCQDSRIGLFNGSTVLLTAY